MKCEEFEAIGLDAGRDASLTAAQRAASSEHAARCSRCAALRDSWEAARAELSVLAEDTATVEAPARVEMRLRQQFRTEHRTFNARRTAVIAAWALAAAAVLVGAVTWVKWHEGHPGATATHLPAPQSASISHAIEPDRNTAGSEKPVQNATVARHRGAARHAGSEALVADNGLSGFTLLPGVFPADTEYGEILRVRMQRGALESFGLPVNEERAGEWIQVDLLVGDDGLPQAVRLSR